MAQLPQAANTEENNQGMDDRSAIPAGDYLAHIVKSEMKETKAKTGHMLALQLKVLEGDYKGRVLFENLNLINPNPVAVEIANKTLNSICQACNLAAVEDSEELHNIPMTISVGIQEATNNYPESNKITMYAPEDGVEAGTGGSSLPWESQETQAE